MLKNLSNDNERRSLFCKRLFKPDKFNTRGSNNHFPDKIQNQDGSYRDQDVNSEVKTSSDNVGFTSYPLERFLGGVDRVVVSQQVEKVETLSAWLSFGCCKVETENRYKVADMDSEKILFMGDEESYWCLRNPCLCCDCIYLCCHAGCSSPAASSPSLSGSFQ